MLLPFIIAFVTTTAMAVVVLGQAQAHHRVSWPFHAP
eukprot:SAG31_NODE_20275_length_578_cov_42.945720_1_plen_36_part_10